MRATLGTSNTSCSSGHAFIIAIIILINNWFSSLFSWLHIEYLKGQCGLVLQCIPTPDSWQILRKCELNEWMNEWVPPYRLWYIYRYTYILPDGYISMHMAITLGRYTSSRFDKCLITWLTGASVYASASVSVSISRWDLSVFSVKMKLEKPVFVLPVTYQTQQVRQGLNLYGLFIQMDGDLRRQGVCTLTDRLNFPFKPTFLWEGKSVGKGSGIQGKKV